MLSISIRNMPTFSLKKFLQDALNGDYAIGHFNIADSIVLSAVVAACKNMNATVFVGTSEHEAEFIGYGKAVALRDAWRMETGLPVFLNADHHKSFETAKLAIDAGYDSIHIDASKLSDSENQALTKKVVEYAHGCNPDISVEGEIGYIVTDSSQVYKEAVEIPEESLTTPEQAKEFVEKTGVDRLAIAIGTLHGIVEGSSVAEHLHLDRLAEIHAAIPSTPLTLHGGSGAPHEDITGCLSLGISNIHISTEIRIAFASALAGEFKNNPDETTPYKYFAPAREAAQKVVEEHLGLFQAGNRV